MTLDDNLNVDEQRELIAEGETTFKETEGWRAFSERYGPLAALHSPYAGLVNTVGHYLIQNAAQFTHPIAMSLDEAEQIASMVANNGGTAAFDRQYGLHELESFREHIPSDSNVKISNPTWDHRIIDYVTRMYSTLIGLVSLPDTSENEEAIGLVRNDLIDLFAYTQAYLLAKTRGGLDAVKKNIQDLQGGKLVPSLSYI